MYRERPFAYACTLYIKLQNLNSVVPNIFLACDPMMTSQMFGCILFELDVLEINQSKRLQLFKTSIFFY